MKSYICSITAIACSFGVLQAEESSEKSSEKGRPGSGMFRQLDTDGDQAISKEEAGERWQRLGQLDKDNDGKVTGQELMAGRPDGKGKGKGNAGEATTPGAGKPSEGETPGAGRPGQGRPGTAGSGEMFKRADKNGDGKLTEDEVPEQFWARLSQLDKNSDNAISQEEAAAGRSSAPGGSGQRPEPGAMFSRADQNGDGRISQDEVPAEAWARMKRLDKNEDGAVSREEIGAMSGARPGGGPSEEGTMAGKGKSEGKAKAKAGATGGSGAIFSRMDKNADDKLSKDEVPAEMWEKIRKADTDADGLVSKQELEGVYQKRS
ncbi:MAG: hypothetical protein AAGA96_17435 [Verrucomicrobiota bacterium]